MFYNYVGKHYSKIATGHYAQVLFGDESVKQSNALFEADKAEAETLRTPSAVIEFDDSDSYSIGTDSESVKEADMFKYQSLPEDLPLGRVSEGARLVMSPDSITKSASFPTDIEPLVCS